MRGPPGKLASKALPPSASSFAYKGAEDALSRLGLLCDGELTNTADVLFCPSCDVQLKMGVFADHERIEALDIPKGTAQGAPPDYSAFQAA